MEKQAIRERVWDGLEERGAARFPFPPHGRIPNFAGADQAADRLAETTAWRTASTVKSNPDAPQRPVRRRALEGGKTVYMAVPRLRDEQCFLRLDPAEIADIDEATTIGGAAEWGEPVRPAVVEAIDLIVSGSVAVDERGVRIGKGEGYSDLEYAILRECELVTAETPVATTVHPSQVVSEPIEPAAHDVPMDLIVTPDRTRYPDSPFDPPAGIDWSLVDEADRDEMPILAALWSERAT